MEITLLTILFLYGNGVILIPSVRAGDTNDTRDLDGCKHLCGQWRELPCSCDPKCLVYNVCCEDFEAECPEIFHISEAQYAGLIRSKVKCIDDNFVITSCSETEIVSDTSSILHTNRAFSNSTLPRQDKYLESILNLIPVLDLSTGFSFINRTIFNCHKGKHSEAINWDIAIQDNEHLFNFHTNQLNLEEINKIRSVYLSPWRKWKNVSTPFCSEGSIDSCSKQNHSLESKCKSFISYVWNKDLVVFNNKYCAYCNEIHDISTLDKFWRNNKHKYKFDVVMSITEADVTLAFVGNLFLSSNWETIQCNRVGQNHLKNNSNQYKKCDVSCQQGFARRPNRQCQESLILQIAISTAMFSPGVTNAKILADFVHCFLAKVLSLDIESILNFSKVDRFYDIKGNFYYVELLVYNRGSIFMPDSLMTKNFIDLLGKNILENRVSATKRNLDLGPEVKTAPGPLKICGMLFNAKYKNSERFQKEYGTMFCSQDVNETSADNETNRIICQFHLSRCACMKHILFHVLRIHLFVVIVSSFI
ncbi:Aquaporin-7 [Biomphalaria glabrata]|nr:hypothetical protein BgiMline_013452 [Biomphalaria glabrata]